MSGRLARSGRWWMLAGALTSLAIVFAYMLRGAGRGSRPVARRAVPEAWPDEPPPDVDSEPAVVAASR